MADLCAAGDTGHQLSQQRVFGDPGGMEPRVQSRSVVGAD